MMKVTFLNISLFFAALYSPCILHAEEPARSTNLDKHGDSPPLDVGQIGPRNSSSDASLIPIHKLDIQNDAGQTVMKGPATENRTGPLYINPDSILVGGVVLPNYATYGSSGNLMIRGAPYGPFDDGTLLSVIMTNSSATNSPSAISGTLKYNDTVRALANGSGLDVSAEYNGTQNLPAKLILQDVTYDSKNIILHSPLSVEKTKVLRRWSYLITNSVSPNIKPYRCADIDFCDFQHLNLYGAVLTGWKLNQAGQATSLQVEGWTVPGSGDTSLDQSPQGKKIDTTFSHYDGQTLFIGVPLKVFNQNLTMSYNPTDASFVHSLEGLELDEFYNSPLNAQSSIHGMTFAFSGGISKNGSHTTPTTDSYQLRLAGNMPHQLLLDHGFIDTIHADAFRLYGSDQTAQTIGETNEIAEYINRAGGNTDSLKTYLRLDALDSPSQSGFRNRSLHQQLYVDSNPGLTTTGASGGDLVYNRPGYLFGISLCVNKDSSCINVGRSGDTFVDGALRVGKDVITPSIHFGTKAGKSGGKISPDVAGNLTIGAASSSTHIISENPFVFRSYSFKNLPPTGTAGQQVFCLDCLKPAETAGTGTGMMVFDDGHSRWISLTGNLAAQ